MLVYAVTADIIAPILAMLFQLINQSGEIPTLFRETKVKLLYKKKDKTTALYPYRTTWAKYGKDV